MDDEPIVKRTIGATTEQPAVVIVPPAELEEPETENADETPDPDNGGTKPASPRKGAVD